MPLIGQDISYRHFTMEDGLSQMKINSLVCDSIGNIWIGTRNGLNKFNGEKFTIYNTSDGLLHERIHQLALNTRNEIVALTYGGLSIFDGEKFTNYAHDFIYVLYELAVDNNDNVWIYDRSRSELTYLKDGMFHLFDDSLEENYTVKGISSSKDDNEVYIGTDKGIFKVEWDGELKLILINDTPVDHADPSGHLDGLPLFATESSSKSKIGQVLVENKLNPAYKIDRIADPPKAVLYNNRVWVKYFSYAAIPINGSSKMTDEFTQVNAMIQDQQGQFWLGTEIGLIQLFSDQFLSVSYDDFPYVWSVIEDNEQNIWTSSFGKGLYFYPNGANPKPIKSNVFRNNSFLAATAKDHLGNLYFGHASDLYKWDGKKFSRIYNGSTFSLAYDEQRKSLITGVENGIFIIKNDTEIDTIDQVDGMHNCHYIQALEIDHKGNYWAGSYTGLSKVNPISNEVTNYSRNENLLSRGIYDIFSDNEGHLWLGSESGLLYYNESKDSFHLIESSLLNTIVKSIIDLDKDHLLIGAKDGLYVFNKRNYLDSSRVIFKIYNNSNGYEGIEPGFSGLYKDTKGKIWITSATDLITFRNRNFSLENQILRSEITQVNGQRIQLNHSTDYVDTFHKEDIQIDFEAVGSVRPSIIKYQYQLNSEKWSPWSEENSVVFNNLNTGEYTLKVRSGPTDSQLNDQQIDQINFVVKIPFYRSSWFPPLAISLLLIALGTALFYIYRSHLERNRYLKSTNEANYLRSQLLLSELNPHFIFNVLASIQSKVLNDQPRQASEYIVRLSKLIRNFLEASYKGNTSNSIVADQDILLSKEIELIELFILFEQDKSNDFFDYSITIDPDLDIENTFLPPMLIQPFVENAIKHGLLPHDEKGILSIQFLKLDDGIHCIIKDNGVGLKSNKKYDFSTHLSLGSKIVKERIQILNELGNDIRLMVEEPPSGGTQVTLSILDEQ